MAASPPGSSGSPALSTYYQNHRFGSSSSTARLMCTKQELAIFRRFDEIHLLNLLVLQDEIDQLSQELKKHEPPIDDVAAPPAVPLWYSLPRPIASHRQGVEDHEATMALHKRRAEIWNDLRLKLREYDSAILDFASLRGLEEPSGQDVKQLRMDLDTMKSRHGTFQEMARAWDNEYDDDFVTLRIARDKGSALINTVKLAWKVFGWELVGRRKAPTSSIEPGMPREIVLGKQKSPISRAEMAQKHARTSRFIMAFFGGVALIVPTIAMSKFEGIDNSLIITSVAVLIFGFLAALLGTDSTGKDVLAATAAYTAVLVVFVGTSLASKGVEAVAPVETQS